MNLVCHEYLEDLPKISGDYNKIICGEKDLCDERKLTFAPIIVRGTVALVSHLRFGLKKMGWPDLIWPFNQPKEKFCYEYLTNVASRHLLNYDVEFGNSEKVLEQRFPLWVRSDSGQKTFGGGAFNRKDFLVELDYLRQVNQPDVRFAFCQKKDLGEEWRFFVIGGEIIGSSKYMQYGEPDIKDDVPERAIDFANFWIKENGRNWGGNFVLDLGRDLNFGIRVVEVNSLNSSGAYCCDLARIWEAMINQAKLAAKL